METHSLWGHTIPFISAIETAFLLAVPWKRVISFRNSISYSTDFLLKILSSVWKLTVFTPHHPWQGYFYSLSCFVSCTFCPQNKFLKNHYFSKMKRFNPFWKCIHTSYSTQKRNCIKSLTRLLTKKFSFIFT